MLNPIMVCRDVAVIDVSGQIAKRISSFEQVLSFIEDMRLYRARVIIFNLARITTIDQYMASNLTYIANSLNSSGRDFYVINFCDSIRDSHLPIIASLTRLSLPVDDLFVRYVPEDGYNNIIN